MRLTALLYLLLAALPAAAAAVPPHAVAFIYHRFGETRYPSTSITLGQFDAQLDYLARHHYHVWPLELIVAHLRAGRAIPDHTVAITIDDAFRSVYEHAYPRLRARGWPFTVFVSTEAVDRRLPAFMSWAQMRRMAAHGAHFADHGTRHVHMLERLPGEDETAWRARIRRNILHGHARLVAELGPAVDTAPKLFAYPYGEYDTALANLVRSLGFVGLGQESGAIGAHSDLRALPRFPMAERFAALDSFALKAAALPLQPTSIQPWEPVATQNPPRLTLQFAAGGAQLSRLQLGQLSCYASDRGRIGVKRVGETGFVIEATKPFPRGRARYNCTAPDAAGKRWYWYSHPWLIR